MQTFTMEDENVESKTTGKSFEDLYILGMEVRRSVGYLLGSVVALLQSPKRSVLDWYPVHNHISHHLPFRYLLNQLTIAL